MSFVSVFLEASVVCPRCQQPIHLNGAAESVLCDKCQHVLPLAPEAWASLISDKISEAAQLEDGNGLQSTELGGMNATFKYGRLPARCEKCKTAFPITNVSQLGGQIFCPGCGQRTAGRPAPAWMKAVHPAIVGLVGESHGGDTAAPMTGIEPVVIHCYGCGGKLSCDGSTRQVVCQYCQAENFLPDQLWLRLHPAAIRTPWFILLDLGGAVGMLPDDAWSFCGIVYGPTGGAIVAYIDSDDNCFIDGLDANGLVAWRCTSIQFSSDARLLVAPGASYVAIADSDSDKNFLQYLDPRTGQPMWRVQGREASSDETPDPWMARPFDLSDTRGLALDADGTIVLLQYGSDEDAPLLTRYSGDGSCVPMWASEHKRRRGWDQPEWSDVRDGVLIPPDDAMVAVGNDGNLYLVDENLRHLAAFDRHGRMVRNQPLQPPAIDTLRAVGADSAGTVYALCEMDGGGKSSHAHLVRVFAGYPPEVLAGPARPGTGPLGEYDQFMAVAPNGSTYIAYELSSIRTIDGYGRAAWRTHTTVKNDAENS